MGTRLVPLHQPTGASVGNGLFAHAFKVVERWIQFVCVNKSSSGLENAFKNCIMQPSVPSYKATQAIRAFLALPLPREVIGRLQSLQKELNASLDEVSWSRPNALHLTIRFFGNMPVELIDELKRVICAICSSASPFRLNAMNVGVFGERVVWVGVGGAIKPLEELESRIGQATREFGDHREDRAFRPHLTIGRIKKGRRSRISIADKLVDYSNVKFGEWTVDHLELMRSDLSPQGAEYSCLARLPLTGKVGGAGDS